MKIHGSKETVQLGMHWDFFTDKIYTDWSYIIPFYVVASVSFALFVGNYSSIGFFLPFMTKQVTMAFISIQVRLTDLSRKSKIMKKNEMKFKLKQIIVEHNNAIRFADDIEQAFNKIYLIKSGLAALFTCFILFSIFISGSSFFDVFKIGIFGMVIQMELFVNFYIGDKLTEESEKISDVAYDFPWYDSDIEVRKVLLMILRQAQRPIELSAGKFSPISIYSYGRILNAAYSYLMFLKNCITK
uniref:CSON011869 protein n=1 Tax=Culicoides sonorensis TaxID=179676 RepID=A0A336M9J4_CULSO